MVEAGQLTMLQDSQPQANREEKEVAKKKVFVSFDFDNDRTYKYTFEMWNKNPSFEFEFDDKTPREINTDNVDRVKAVLTTKIKSADYCLVIVGKEANKRHKDHKLVGYQNWQNFEVAQSKAYRKKLVAVKIDKSYESPSELLNSGAKWAMSFTQDSIIKALNES